MNSKVSRACKYFTIKNGHCHRLFLKHPKTQQERRTSLDCDRLYVRPKRNKNNLPTAYDDISVGFDKSNWKATKLNKQYMVDNNKERINKMEYEKFKPINVDIKYTGCKKFEFNGYNLAVKGNKGSTTRHLYAVDNATGFVEGYMVVQDEEGTLALDGKSNCAVCIGCDDWYEYTGPMELKLDKESRYILVNSEERK